MLDSWTYSGLDGLSLIGGTLLILLKAAQRCMKLKSTKPEYALRACIIETSAGRAAKIYFTPRLTWQN